MWSWMSSWQTSWMSSLRHRSRYPAENPGIHGELGTEHNTDVVIWWHLVSCRYDYWTHVVDVFVYVLVNSQFRKECRISTSYLEIHQFFFHAYLVQVCNDINCMQSSKTRLSCDRRFRSSIRSRFSRFISFQQYFLNSFTLKNEKKRIAGRLSLFPSGFCLPSAKRTLWGGISHLIIPHGETRDPTVKQRTANSRGKKDEYVQVRWQIPVEWTRNKINIHEANRWKDSLLTIEFRQSLAYRPFLERCKFDCLDSIQITSDKREGRGSCILVAQRQEILPLDRLQGRS